MTPRAKIIIAGLLGLGLVLMSGTCKGEMWMEIAPGMAANSVEVRVMDSEFRSVYYWIDRSDDGGRTWRQYLLLFNGEWEYVNTIAPRSMFRGRIP